MDARLVLAGVQWRDSVQNEAGVRGAGEDHAVAVPLIIQRFGPSSSDSENYVVPVGGRAALWLQNNRRGNFDGSDDLHQVVRQVRIELPGLRVEEIRGRTAIRPDNRNPNHRAAAACQVSDLAENNAVVVAADALTGCYRMDFERAR